MNPNPLSDVISFLLQPAWTTGIFWLLTLTSIGVAAYAFRTIPGQRSIEHVGNFVFRFLIGAMWWQQSLWKLPPFYTDQPQEPPGNPGPPPGDGDGDGSPDGGGGGGSANYRGPTPLTAELLASRLGEELNPFSATGSILALGMLGWTFLGPRNGRRR